MTSPSQLKYLDAMGIPVWISRDLVIDKTILVDDLENGFAQENSQNQTSSVNSILDELDAQISPSIKLSPTDHSQKPLHIKTQQEVVTPQNRANPNDTNQAFYTDLAITYVCGSLNADWMVIGESPELSNDRSNQPYPSEQGELLSNMLIATGHDRPRHNSYLLNTIKRSVSSTVALQEKSDQELRQFLLTTIEKIKPKMVLVVGQIAAQKLLKTKEPLARLRGKVHQISKSKTPLVVTYYPSYLLSKPLDKRKAWDDLKLAMRQPR